MHSGGSASASAGIGTPKRSVTDLALLGGRPLFEEPLHVGRPSIGDRAKLFERLSDALDRRVLSNDGPLVREFEERIADLVGARHVLAVNNATIGLQIAAGAAGLSGEVIVPAFTFVATAHALAWIGIEPVFCDIDPDTLTIDPLAAERLVGPDTSGIVGVHLWGHPCDTEALDTLAGRHSLQVLYDAAHAFACGRDGRMVGTYGRAEVFSFHATKFVNAFEGGAIATDDDDVAERVRRLRNFGFRGLDRTVGIGTNGKMSEASAAMGLTSLDALPSIVAVNWANAEHYAAHLADMPGLRLLTPDRRGQCNAQHVALRVDGAAAGLSRDDLYALLRAENVLARRYFHPGVHRMEPYASRPGGAPRLPATEALAEECLVLPTGTAVGAREIEAIGSLVRFALDHGPEIRRRLRERGRAAARSG
jgi:dTDP-4-amino-4,6-dideoxygalactose transaminase